MVCLDTNQNILHFGVGFFQIVAVVGCGKGNTGFPGKPPEQGKDPFLLLDAVILNLKKVIVLSEDFPIPQGRAFRLLVFPGRQPPRNLSCQTGGQADQSAMILF